MACFVIAIVLFYRKESLENKKSEKSEGDQKKPKDSKVFILKLVSFLRSNFTDFFWGVLCIVHCTISFRSPIIHHVFFQAKET